MYAGISAADANPAASTKPNAPQKKLHAKPQPNLSETDESDMGSEADSDSESDLDLLGKDSDDDADRLDDESSLGDEVVSEMDSEAGAKAGAASEDDLSQEAQQERQVTSAADKGKAQEAMLGEQLIADLMLACSSS